jgi:hypothetical protein
MTAVHHVKTCGCAICTAVRSNLAADGAAAMSRDDLREAVARALYVAKGAHNVFGPWETQLYPNLKEPFRRQANALIDPIVERELSAARPVIGRETREAVAAWLQNADPWHGVDPHTANYLAAAIRNQP